MKGRALRMKVSTTIFAWYADRVCELLDISVTGALVVQDAELPVGSRQTFRLGDDNRPLELSASVVRVRQTNERPPRWQIALNFEDVSPATRRQISSTASRLIAAPPRQTRPGAREPPSSRVERHASTRVPPGPVCRATWAT